MARALLTISSAITDGRPALDSPPAMTHWAFRTRTAMRWSSRATHHRRIRSVRASGRRTAAPNAWSWSVSLNPSRACTEMTITFARTLTAVTAAATLIAVVVAPLPRAIRTSDHIRENMRNPRTAMPAAQAMTITLVSQSRLPRGIRPEWSLWARRQSPAKAKQPYDTSVIIAARAIVGGGPAVSRRLPGDSYGVTPGAGGKRELGGLAVGRINDERDRGRARVAGRLRQRDVGRGQGGGRLVRGRRGRDDDHIG